MELDSISSACCSRKTVQLRCKRQSHAEWHPWSRPSAVEMVFALVCKALR